MNQQATMQRIFPRRLDIQKKADYLRLVKRQPKFPINLQVPDLFIHSETHCFFTEKLQNNKAWKQMIKKVKYVGKVQLGEDWKSVIGHYKSCHRVHSLRLRWSFEKLFPIKTRSGMSLNIFQNLTELILEDF